VDDHILSKDQKDQMIFDLKKTNEEFKTELHRQEAIFDEKTKKAAKKHSESKTKIEIAVKQI
jgi:hypothetical protein